MLVGRGYKLQLSLQFSCRSVLTYKELDMPSSNDRLDMSIRSAQRLASTARHLTTSAHPRTSTMTYVPRLVNPANTFGTALVI